MRVYISHSSQMDYQNELYEPLKSHPSICRDHELFFPHDPENIDLPAEPVLQNIDLMIAEVSYPSTGQGIELGQAAAANVRIACVYMQGGSYSSSLRFVTDTIEPYETPADMLAVIERLLAQN